MIRIPHLETDVTSSCQLSCVACNHAVPLYRAHGQRHADPAQVERDLNHLATILHADRWGALGGEPLLSRSLIDILGVARRSGVADRIEVWTNGLLLPRMTPEFWASFDILVLSVYPGKHTPESLAWIARRCAEAGVQLDVKDEVHAPNFKTLFEPPSGPARTQEKFDRCFFRGFSRVANRGFFFTCCCAPHLPALVQGRAFGEDGVAIAGLTEAALRAYLGRREPLGACAICAGRDTAVNVTWREEREPLRWMEASGAPALAQQKEKTT